MCAFIESFRFCRANSAYISCCCITFHCLGVTLFPLYSCLQVYGHNVRFLNISGNRFHLLRTWTEIIPSPPMELTPTHHFACGASWTRISFVPVLKSGANFAGQVSSRIGCNWERSRGACALCVWSPFPKSCVPVPVSFLSGRASQDSSAPRPGYSIATPHHLIDK